MIWSSIIKITFIYRRQRQRVSVGSGTTTNFAQVAFRPSCIAGRILVQQLRYLQIFISCLMLKLHNLNHIHLAAAKPESFGRQRHDYYFCAGNKKQRPVSYFLPHANSFLRLKLGHIPHIRLSVHMSIMDRGFMANQSLLLLHTVAITKSIFLLVSKTVNIVYKIYEILLCVYQRSESS